MQGATNLRIAVACSGLGHVRRGIEAWAEDLAHALHEVGERVTLFRGAGPCEPWASRIPCLTRFDSRANTLSIPFRHLGGWRYGLGSPCDIEQTTFSIGLWRQIRRDFDIVHVQDYWIGRHLTAMYKCGLSHAQVIVGNGTAATPEMQTRFLNVQHLTPAQEDAWVPHRVAGQRSFVVPNFISTERFRPAPKQDARRAWGLPSDAFIVLCVAALRRRFKRVDYLIREFAKFEATCNSPAVLVLAGGHEGDTPELLALAQDLLGQRVIVLENLPRDRMASLYATADIFTIPALDEVFGIAFLEAMSCGVPIIANDTSAMRWVGGTAALYANLAREGGLVEALSKLRQDGLLERLSRAARQHVQSHFSESSVVPRILNMYQTVVQNGEA